MTYESLWKRKGKNSEELVNSLKSLSYEMSRLKTMVQLDRRQKTPTEIIEDYFLEYKEIERFYIEIDRNTSGIGPIAFDMWNMLDIDTIESEFYRHVNKLESIKKRLQEIEAFKCHFKISLNGKDQSKYNDKEYQYNIYEYQGLGDRKWGYAIGRDGKKQEYTDVRYNDVPHDLYHVKFPENKVAIRISFYII